jgi:hypothetical protein
LLDVLVLEKLKGQALPNHVPCLDHITSMSNLESNMGILFHEQNGDSPLVDSLNHLEDSFDDNRG